MADVGASTAPAAGGFSQYYQTSLPANMDWADPTQLIANKEWVGAEMFILIHIRHKSVRVGEISKAWFDS